MVHPPGGGRRERLSKHPALDSHSIQECTGENLLRDAVPRSGSVDGRTARCRGEASQRNWGRPHDTSRRARRTERPPLRAVPCRLQDRSAGNRGAAPPPRLDGFASPLRSGGERGRLAGLKTAPSPLRPASDLFQGTNLSSRSIHREKWPHLHRILARPIRCAAWNPTVDFSCSYRGSWSMIRFDGAVWHPSSISSGDSTLPQIRFSFSIALRVCDQHRLVHMDPALGQMGLQYGIRERLFSLALCEEIQTRHQCGPPPMMFFSQISPRE